MIQIILSDESERKEIVKEVTRKSTNLYIVKTFSSEYTVDLFDDDMKNNEFVKAYKKGDFSNVTIFQREDGTFYC